MTTAVIVSTARTPLAKSWKGAFNMTHGATLGGHAVAAAVQRAGIDPGAIEDVLMGCANPEGATGWNIARQVALRAGLPMNVSGITVNRFCSSGLQTIALAAQRIIAGEGEVYVAGGVESISCVQQEMNQHMFIDSWLQQHKPEIYWPMLQTAENVAKRYGMSRERMDQFGAESQQKACAAQAAGLFDAEIAPITMLKLVIHPALCYLVLSWVGDFPRIWMFSAVLLASLPTATNVFVIAQQYGVWVQRASASVLVTTCASVLTVTGLLYLITSGTLPPDLFPGR